MEVFTVKLITTAQANYSCKMLVSRALQKGKKEYKIQTNKLWWANFSAGVGSVSFLLLGAMQCNANVVCLMVRWIGTWSGPLG